MYIFRYVRVQCTDIYALFYGNEKWLQVMYVLCNQFSGCQICLTQFKPSYRLHGRGALSHPHLIQVVFEHMKYFLHIQPRFKCYTVQNGTIKATFEALVLKGSIYKGRLTHQHCDMTSQKREVLCPNCTYVGLIQCLVLSLDRDPHCAYSHKHINIRPDHIYIMTEHLHVVLLSALCK